MEVKEIKRSGARKLPVRPLIIDSLAHLSEEIKKPMPKVEAKVEMPIIEEKKPEIKKVQPKRESKRHFDFASKKPVYEPPKPKLPVPQIKMAAPYGRRVPVFASALTPDLISGRKMPVYAIDVKS